jgi:hypothetical protein
MGGVRLGLFADHHLKFHDRLPALDCGASYANVVDAFAEALSRISSGHVLARNISTNQLRVLQKFLLNLQIELVFNLLQLFPPKQRLKCRPALHGEGFSQLSKSFEKDPSPWLRIRVLASSVFNLFL